MTSTQPQLVDLDQLQALAHRSHQVITNHQNPGGAYPASPTFSAYRGYAWLRDGAFTAEGVSRYGDTASAGRFHDWVVDVLTARRGQVEDLLRATARGNEPPVTSMLPTRFTFTGQDGSDPWWDFQTDGYGIWLWAVGAHANRHGLDHALWLPGIEVAVDYLTAFWNLPCYDWWEEHVEHRHVSTLGAIHAGLKAAARITALDLVRRERAAQAAAQVKDLILREGVAGGHLTKWLGTSEVDASLAACIVPFGVIDAKSDLAGATLATIGEHLDVGGGVHRFRADVFYGGGQWLLLSALLGWNRAAAGDTDGAWGHLRWIAAHATDDGLLPEQVQDHLLHPHTQAEWVTRWGTVATPLLWSHGMYLILADELGLLKDHTS